MLAFANDGTVLLVGLMSRGAGLGGVGGARDVDIALWRSNDGGLTFSQPQIVVNADGIRSGLAPVGRTVVAGGWSDKEFLVVDRGTGTVHLFWNAIGTSVSGVAYPGGVDVVGMRSEDGGATWSEPVVVGAGRYGASAAAHNGTILVTFRNPSYFVTRSTDGGATWGEPVEIGELPGPDGTWQAAPPALWSVNGTLRAAIALASGDQGERVHLLTSGDGGATWSEPLPALPEMPSTKRDPVLAVDPFGGVGIVGAYSGLSGEGMSVWVAPLVDGALGAPVRAGSVDGETYLFEYFGAGSAGGRSYAAWGLEGAKGSPLLVAGSD